MKSVMVKRIVYGLVRKVVSMTAVYRELEKENAGLRARRDTLMAEKANLTLINQKLNERLKKKTEKLKKIQGKEDRAEGMKKRGSKDESGSALPEEFPPDTSASSKE